jgi:hypothetical protein
MGDLWRSSPEHAHTRHLKSKNASRDGKHRNPPRPPKRHGCRYCGLELPAWLSVFQEPNGALLLHYLGAVHPTEVGADLARIHTHYDGEPMAAAYEVVEDGPE